MQSPNEDIGETFVESLESEMEAIHKILKSYTEMKELTDEEWEQCKNAERYYACNGPFTPENKKVIGHCHLTGKYRGAACNNCNLRMQVPGFVPVLFHNLEGYDSHLFIKNLGYNTDENISCILKTDEKYI